MKPQNSQRRDKKKKENQDGKIASSFWTWHKDWQQQREKKIKNVEVFHDDMTEPKAACKSFL